MDKKNLTEYADFLLNTALYKCGNMRIVKNALDNGLFPKCADYPAPAVLISVNEN